VKKQLYESPHVTITALDREDIICTSRPEQEETFYEGWLS
jgi:hypothetical protein